MPDLKTSMHIAASGMKVQTERLRIIAQNIANAESTGTTPGAEPYQRKTITFQNVLDRELGHEVVKVTQVGRDETPFPMEYNPGHPAANADGYVLKPNVQTLIETQDMKQAQRSYEANISTIEITKRMLSRTLELMR